MDLSRSAYLIRSVELPFITGGYPIQDTIMVNFLIVNSLSMNNVIIARTI